MAKRIVIAIDGPAGSGKSTIARRIADRLGFTYIDTGAMYRSVARWALGLGTSLTDHHRLEELARQAHIEFAPGTRAVLLNGEDVTSAIRTPEVSEAASKVSAVPGVRRALVEKQREMAGATSVVMEGRDIGTVVFPDANVKIFLDAHPEARAERRTRELVSAGGAMSGERVAEEIRERDQRDRTRAESPLVQAPDAVYIDTTGMPVDDVEAAVLKIVRDRTSNGQELSR